jgi:hypothetical protein
MQNMTEERGTANHYQVNSQLPIRAPLVRDRKVADLLELFQSQ